MKIYGNKGGELKSVKRKESELQKKIYETEENKIKEPWFNFWGKVFFFGLLLYMIYDKFN